MERKALKELIRAKGKTQQQLADEIGVTIQAIAEVVAGRSKGAAIRYSIAKALGLEVEDIWPSGKVEAA